MGKTRAILVLFLLSGLIYGATAMSASPPKAQVALAASNRDEVWKHHREFPTTTSSTSSTTTTQPVVAKKGSRSYTRPVPKDLTEILACIRGGGKYPSNESGGNYANKSNPTYRGAYQADRSTWNGFWTRHHRPDLVGTDPANASHADQDAFAAGLYSERGIQPWPRRGACVR